MRRELSVLSLAALVVAAGPVLLANEPAPETPEFRERAVTAFHADTAAIREFSFSRKVIRRTLDRNGGEKSLEVLNSRVTPKEVGFDELLTDIDGRVPSEAEVRRHREAAIFSKHHRQLTAGRVEMGLVADLELSVLLNTYNYEYAGEAVMHGAPCFRFLVKPFSPPEGASRTERVAAASHGSFWFTREGQHLARMEVRLASPLKMIGVTLKTLDLTLDRQQLDGVWLTTRAEVRSEFKLGVTIRKHNTWMYSDFERFRRD